MEHHDVVICGSGSAGLCTATWLARFGIRCKILEKSSGPMEIGQADGVQCRTVEVYDSFGLADDILREAFHVLEISFWSGADESGGIQRTGRMTDTPPGLSTQPHLILNQARMNGVLLEAMRRFNGQEVDYGYDVRRVSVDSAADKDYPVLVTAEKDGQPVELRAKYALGCDGAHSTVRRSLGISMVGDSSDAVWGVMDSYPRTNFPDIRKKSVIQSSSGNLLVIPREGGSLVRYYIELPGGTKAADVTLADLQQSSRNIFHPYQMEFAEVFWWSAYSVGQRCADAFHVQNRVFLMGDACHTHSPKAGQGMNVSLQDGYNMGWKLAQTLRWRVRSELLPSYVLERQKTAEDLIEFDRYFTKMWTARAASRTDFDPEALNQAFIKSARYTAGLTARYEQSLAADVQGSQPEAAKNLTVGMRLTSTQVVRFCDVKPVQMVKALPADGRWRVLIFAGDSSGPTPLDQLRRLAPHLKAMNDPFAPSEEVPGGHDPDAYVEPIIVFAGKRTDLEQDQIPDEYWPATGRLGMRDLHKSYFDDEANDLSHGHAYDFYGVDKDRGALVVVRPDHYVAMITALGSQDRVLAFFNKLHGSSSADKPLIGHPKNGTTGG